MLENGKGRLVPVGVHLVEHLEEFQVLLVQVHHLPENADAPFIWGFDYKVTNYSFIKTK